MPSFAIYASYSEARRTLYWSSHKVFKKDATMKFSERAQTLLESSGWTPERNIRIEHEYSKFFLRIRSDSKYKRRYGKLNQLKPALNNLCGLDIPPYSDYQFKRLGIKFHLNLMNQKNINVLLDQIFLKTNIPMICIGTAFVGLILMDMNGTLYAPSEVYACIFIIGDIKNPDTMDTILFNAPSLLDCEKIDFFGDSNFLSYE